MSQPTGVWQLPNGLRVELSVSDKPDAGDVLVYSTDERGNPDALGTLVLKANGIPLMLASVVFNPPASVTKLGTKLARGPILLAVQVTQDGRGGREVIEFALAAGLEKLHSQAEPIKSLWVPLLGTSDGGLSAQQSAEMILDVLARWSRGGIEVARLAAPTSQVAEEIRQVLRARWAPPSTLSLHPEHVEDHVGRALRAAWAIAAREPVNALHVMRAVVGLAPRAKSRAFSRFRELVLPRPGIFHPEVEHVIESSEASGKEEPLVPEMLDEALRRELTRAQYQTGPASPALGRLWGRDLVTAALLSADEKITALLSDGGPALEVLRERWFEFVTSGIEADHRDWRRWWLAAGVPLPGYRRAGYATETDEGQDKLGVKAEAAAFARLILDSDVEPPLSIGLLGDWGSGKSFFIEQIKDQIKELRGKPGLHEHVVEIEFNAWHVSDTNLWASLVTHIFDEIWRNVAVDGTEQKPEVARLRLLDELKQAGGAVHEAEAQLAQARDALENAEKELQSRRETLALRQYLEEVAVKELQELARKAGWQEPLEAIQDVEKATRQLAASGDRLRLMLANLLERPIGNIFLPVAGVGLVAAGLWSVALPALNVAEQTRQVLQWLVAVAGSVSALVAPLKAASSKVSGFADGLEKLTHGYEEKLKALKPEEAAKVASARRELASAEASVITARTHLAELRNQLAAMEPGQRLSAFLQERVQSTQYRSQQGIISLVHKDFQQLSDRMKIWRKARNQPSTPEASGAAAAPAGIKPFDRIVLYVDDLDRCRPDHVVQMLEAVHLLLALDLFVVVVAVDARWLTRALQVHYRDMLTAMDGPDEDDGLRYSTAHNYLEKIFQVTYALAPMDPVKFQDYVAFLTGGESPVAPGGPTQYGSVTADTPSALSRARVDTRAATPAPSPDAAKHATRTGPETAGEPKPSAGQRSGSSVRSPAPYSVRFDEDERTFLGKLVPLLPTPRIAKRLVNVYRLIKAVKSTEALDTFYREKHHRACLLLLSILFGRPSVAPELLRALCVARVPFAKPGENLVDALRQHVTAGMPDPEAWTELLRELETLAPSITVGQCASQAREVARYSLVTGRDWHTWG